MRDIISRGLLMLHPQSQFLRMFLDMGVFYQDADFAAVSREIPVGAAAIRVVVPAAVSSM